MRKGSKLATFLEILHWSPERLAREINRRYGEGTVSLKAPYGWAKGAYPRGQVPDFVVAILSDQLGRRIDIGQIWPQRFPDTEPGGTDDPGLGPPWSEEHVDHILRSLVGPDEHESGGPPRPGEPVPGAVLVLLAVDWLTTDSRPAVARPEGAELSAEMVDVLVARVARLRRLCASQDSALIMNWVVHELRWARYLTKKAAYDAPTGKRLYRAIAELAQLAGWLAEDQGQYVRGQQYLLAALRASGLAGDRHLGAYILSCLSYHLTKCGNGRDAQRLSKLADAGMDGAVPGVLRSLLVSYEPRVPTRFGDEPVLVDRDSSAVRRIGIEECAVVGAVGQEDKGRLPRQV